MLIILDLLIFGWKGIITVDPAVYRTIPPSISLLREKTGLDRILLTPRTRNNFSMSGRDETEAWLKFKSILFPNFPMAYGVYAADGQEELRYGRYEMILDQIDQDPSSPWMDIFGIKHILSFWGMPTKFSLVANNPINVFRNPRAFPKAYVAYDSVRIPDGEISDYLKRNGSQTLLKSVVLPDENSSSPGCRSSRASAQVVQYLSQSLRIDVDSPCPGWLVLTDAYDAGWQARVNGIRTAVYRVNLMQRGVRISAGKSQIDFLYRPTWLVPALAFSALGWLTVILLAIRWRWPVGLADN